MHPNVIGWGLVNKTHNVNVFAAKEKSLTNAMHAVHDAAIR
jgi:hypothetical protein